MPTYEYECTQCTHEFEQFQSITADPLKECPKCEGEVKRLISLGGGVLFKGSGFYQTDYRSSDYNTQKKADQSSGSSCSSSKSCEK